MKSTKLLLILTLLLCTVLLTGCSAGPGKVVENFFEAIDKGEIEEALGYLSNSTLQTLGADKWRAGLVEVSNEMSAEGGLKSVKILDETVKGEIAQVTFEIIVGNEPAESETLDLIKEDGDWKIRIDPYSK